MDVRRNLLGESILEKNTMNALFSISLAVLANGCAAGSPKSTGLRHESSESALLTEEKFMKRASQSAAKILRRPQFYK